MEIISYLNTVIFIALGAIHFYWGVGGKAYAAAIPTQESGEKLFQPGTSVTIIVAIGLLSFGFIMLAANNLFPWMPKTFVKWGMYTIATIFLLRSIGEFRYIGFFKRIKTTDFAKKDTLIYSPLCLYLGVSTFLIAWF